MTKTEALLRKMKDLPKSIILVGGRSEEEFVKGFFQKSQPTDILWVSDLVSGEVSKIGEHSILAPKGSHRVICVKKVCGARRDNQSTFLKLIEESPERTRWVLSVSNLDRVLKPLISRSFIVDWVQESAPKIQFQDELRELIRSPDYLGIFKLHNRISDEANGEMEIAKQLHMDCLSELMLLLPSEKSNKLLKANNEMKAQLRTEITFKTAVMEAIL